MDLNIINEFALHSAVEDKSEEYINELLTKDVDINQLDCNHQSALHIAVNKNRIKVIELLLSHGANINIKDKRTGTTPLHLSIKRKHIEITKLLLEKGANVNEVTKHNSTALHIALESHEEQLVKYVLDYGANIDTKKFGRSPLHLAVESGNINLVKLILSKGVNVDDATIDGQTALHMAIEMKNDKIVRILLDSGAKTDIKKFGKCPLHLAVTCGSVEIAKLIVKKTTVRKNQSKALMYAFSRYQKEIVHEFLEYMDPNLEMNDKRPLYLAVEKGWYDTVSLLLSKKADVQAVTDDNVSILHVALENYHYDLVELLLKHGAEVNISQNRSGITPLHLAVKNRRLDVVQKLLIQGANIDALTNLKVTALHMAFELQDKNMINCLLDYKADPNIAKNGKSPLEIAIECCWTDLARRLLEQGADPNTSGLSSPNMIFAAVKLRNIEMIQLLIEFGVDVNAIDPKTEKSPLQLAVRLKCDEVAEILLNNGADVNYATSDGMTALQLSLDRRNEKMVHLFLKRNASLNIKRRARSPLHVAAENSWLAVADMLVNRGANVNEITIYEVTPLLCAIEKRDRRMAELLIAHGADVNSKYYSESLLHVAVSHRSSDMVELLLDWGANINEVCNQLDYDCINALHIALKNGDEKIANILIERKADIKMRGKKKGRTSLHFAAESGCATIVKMLLKKGITANQCDRSQMTPLQLAASRGHCEVAEILIEHGAQIDWRNRLERFTSLHYAVQGKDLEMTKLLLREGASIHISEASTPSPYGMAIQNLKDDEMVKLLLDYDYDSNESVDLVKQSLPYFASLPHGSMIPRIVLRHLARKGPSMNVTIFNKYNITPTLRIYYGHCLDEIKKMQQDTFYEDVSFYNILCNSIRSLTAMMVNENLIDTFERSDYRNKYPIYERTLGERITRAKERRVLLIGAEQMLCVLMRHELPHLIADNILKGLNYTELRIMSNMYGDYLDAVATREATAN